MQQSELKHELVLPPTFPLIRLYRLAWGENAPLDFCHLFWGTLFCWIVPIIAIVLAPFAFIAAMRNRLRARAKRRRESKPPLEPKEPLRSRVALLDKIITAMTKFGMWWRWSLRPWWRAHLNKPLKFLLIGVSVLSLLGGLVVGLYFLIPFLFNLPAYIWGNIGLVVGGLTAICIIGIGAILLVATINDRGYDKKMKAYAAKPPITAWTFMRLAYRSVKVNTCPRIVVEDTGVEQRHVGIGDD